MADFRAQVAGVSLCGALKNIVAVAAGLSDGLGYGNNSKGEFGAVPLCQSHTDDDSRYHANRFDGDEELLPRIF